MIQGKRVTLLPSEKDFLVVYTKNLIADMGYYDEDVDESLIDGIEKRLEDEELIEDFIYSEEKNLVTYMQYHIQDLIVSQ